MLAPAAEQVTVRPFSEVAIYLEHQTAATAASLDNTVLAAEISARVTRLAALPGQAVAAGDLLVELDGSEYQIGLESARARLQTSEAALDMAQIRAERARRLAPDNFVSEDQLLEAETNLRLARAERSAAQAEVRRAELLLARTRITAPFAGAVTERMVSPGTLAGPGTALLSLVAIDGLEVSAMVPPAQVAGLLDARQVVFESEGQQWPVRLARMAPVIDPLSRGREARLVFIDEAPPSGAQGRLRWTDARPALPKDFIVQRNGQLGVLWLQDNSAEVRFHPLPGADAGRPFRPQDLALDALLIDQGRRQLQPGDRVDVVDR
jgi:RND family efflux transporter MFP subunit